MTTKIVTHNGQTCIFEEEVHTYTIQETGQVLTSGTTFIKQFHQAFDGPAVAEKIAAKKIAIKKGFIIARKIAEINRTNSDSTVLLMVSVFMFWISPI